VRRIDSKMAMSEFEETGEEGAISNRVTVINAVCKRNRVRLVSLRTVSATGVRDRITVTHFAISQVHGDLATNAMHFECLDIIWCLTTCHSHVQWV
jgi:hypothetical protein